MEQQRITIDPSVLEKNNMTIAEFIIVLAALWHIDLDDAAHNMIKMGTARVELGLVMPNQIAVERFYAVINDSAIPQVSDDELLDLAKKMKALYPPGMKPGTTMYWADGPQLIARRLRAFLRKYGEYPLEDILDATKRYVSEMKDNVYMRTLRNFIFTEDYSTGESTSSDLYNWLENKGEVSGTHDADWTANIL